MQKLFYSKIVIISLTQTTIFIRQNVYVYLRKVII